MLFLEEASSVQSGINEIISKVMPLIRTLYNTILIAVPVVMLVLGTVDLLKAVTGGDEKDIKGATSMLGKRMLYGVGAFLVLTIVNLVVSIATGSEFNIIWSAGNNTSQGFTITCPKEIEFSDKVNVIVGDITANKDFSECSVPAGYEFIRTGGSTGKLKRTSPDSKFPISELIIKATDSNGDSSECRVKIKK